MRGWRLPHVRPEVARRRRRFFTVVSLLLVGAVGWPMLDDARGSSPSRGAGTLVVGPIQPSQTGCLLHAGTRTLPLPVSLAMTLTDLAGRDQNAAASLAETTNRIALAWPAHAAEAAAVALSLRGYVPGALACPATLPPAHQQAMGADGLTARADTLWHAVNAVFGPLPAGGFMPGGVRTGHVPGSAHYEGRAVDFFYRPITAKTIRHGWVLTQWLEAHAEKLQIATVIFDAQIWTPDGGIAWRPYTYPDGATTNVTLLHYDHVHVDVQRGS